jgi:hypothetical protein
LVLCACWDFGAARARCEDAGVCRFDAGATGDGGAFGGGASVGGGSAGGGGTAGGGTGAGGGVVVDDGGELSAVCNSNGWCAETPKPPPVTLSGVWSDGVTTYLVGDNATLLEYRDGTFTGIPLDAQGEPLDAVTVDSEGAWTAAGRAVVCDNKGGAPSCGGYIGKNLYSAWSSPDGGRVVVGGGQFAYVLEDRIAGLVEVTLDAGVPPLTQVAGRSWADVCAVGGVLLCRQPNGDWAIVDAGQTGWTQTCVDGAGVRWLSSGSKLATWDGNTLLLGMTADSLDVLACEPTRPGAWAASTNGRTLYRCSSPSQCALVANSSENLYALAVPGDGTAFIAGSYGSFAISDGGTGSLLSLQEVLPQQPWAFAFAHAPNGPLFAAASHHSLLQHSPTGWQPVLFMGPTMYDFNDVVFDSPSSAWLAADDGVYRYDQSNFSRPFETNGYSLESIALSTAGAVAVGAGGTIVEGVDGGWSLLSGPDASLPVLLNVKSAGSDVVIAGVTVAERLSIDGGTQPIDVAGASGFHGLYVAPDQELFIGATTGVVHVGATSSELLRVGDAGVVLLGGTGPADVWAATDPPSLFQWNSHAWTSVPGPPVDSIFAMDVTPTAVHISGLLNGHGVIYVLRR